ncbi:MAG: DUF924 family protein [Burkholderiales bacterium]|nr:MAG: DUF924 family protein [Burkholderiales bacterium]
MLDAGRAQISFQLPVARPNEIDEVLDFWLPEGLDRDADRHRARWDWWMHAGAHAGIDARFVDLSERAASGDPSGWAQMPRGRLALVLVLDQFSRSAFCGTPRAYAQDPPALREIYQWCFTQATRHHLAMLERTRRREGVSCRRWANHDVSHSWRHCSASC